MTWGIIVFWWFGGPAFEVEQFGAWPSEEICQQYLQGEIDVAFDLRPGLRGCGGACYRTGQFPPFRREQAQ